MNWIKHWFARINWWLVAIVALGAGLRFYGISFGLPYTYAPDETWHLSVPLRMLKEADPNPQWLGYPHLAFYLSAFVFLIYFLLGRAFGVFQSFADLPYADVITVGVGRLDLPAEFLISRGLTAFFGTASIIVVYLIGRRLHPNKAIGLIAALLFAVSPASVYNSHLIRLDTFAVFFLLLAAFWIDSAFAKPSLRNYIWAGMGIGLAIAGKYNAALIALSLVIAHLLNFGWRGVLRRELYVAGVASVLAVAVTNPFSMLDFPGFLRGLTMASAAQSSHAGMEGDTVVWYATFLWESEGILVVLGLLQALRFLCKRDKRGIVLITFPIVYYLFINQFAVRNDRTVMLVIPFLDLLAALLLIEVYERFVGAVHVQPRVAVAGLLLTIGLVVAQPLRAAILNDAALLKVDSRETARVWIDVNLPPGARIAIEPYSPYVDRGRFAVEAVEGMATHPPDWYVRNGFEYLVFSYGAYGRFYENPTRYPEFVGWYDALFTRFNEVKRFSDGGHEIRIYQTNVSDLPVNRIAARLGVYGEWLEFVGYDQGVPVLPGGTLNVVLHWRALQPRREMFKLTARLLDRANREIAQSSGDLFSTANLEGIARVAWKIAVPPTAAPGMYRLELDVDTDGVGRIPVLDRAQEPVADKLFIGPFKITPTPPAQDELNHARRVALIFENVFALLGYAIPTREVRAGETLRVMLYWKSIAKTDQDYTTFLHLIDSVGNLRAQLDMQPCGGAYPTSLWEAGEIVRDDYALTLPRDLAPGDYKIEIGWYEYPSLARLTVTDATGNPPGDHFMLDEIIRIIP